MRRFTSFPPARTRLSRAMAFLSLALAGAGAQAALITSSADPLLAGASVIGFGEVALGTLNPVIDGVSFTGSGTALNVIDSALPGQTTPILGNSAVLPHNSTSGVDFDIVFGTLVSAFSVDLAGVNGTTTSISAYDASDTLLQTVALPSDATIHTWGFGGFASNIARVHFDTTDFFFTDNLRYVEVAASVPEPGSLLLAGVALAGLAAARTRRPGR